eukprot:COSAG02_NODE_845_length_16583_cov_7.718272_3_plen_407_part_00
MSGAARLWEAAERGDAVGCLEALESGTPVDAAGRTAWTALHRERERSRPCSSVVCVCVLCLCVSVYIYVSACLPACQWMSIRARSLWLGAGAADRGWVNVLRVLLQNGASPARKTETGADTPLHLAAARGHTDITRELLRGGADYRAKARNGWTPLHAAMFHNHTEVARLLIRAGADPIEATVRGSTVRTLSTGGAAEKWTRAPRVGSSSMSGYSDGSSMASPGGRATSPARELVNDVVAARQAALWELRERRSQERERERIDGAEAALQQHLTHQQRRDEKRRQLELSLSIRVSPNTLLAAACPNQPASCSRPCQFWQTPEAWLCFVEGHHHDATPCSHRLAVSSVIAIYLVPTAANATTSGIAAFVYRCYGVAGRISWTFANWCVATLGSLGGSQRPCSSVQYF